MSAEKSTLPRYAQLWYAQLVKKNRTPPAYVPPSNITFSYRARSYWFLGIFAGMALVLLAFLALDLLQVKLWFAILALLFVSFNTSSVSVGVDKNAIVISWGIGLIRRVFFVADVTNLRLKRNNTIWALYAGSNNQVLEITDRAGRKATIGIGETKRMLEFLKGHARGE